MAMASVVNDVSSAESTCCGTKRTIHLCTKHTIHFWHQTHNSPLPEFDLPDGDRHIPQLLQTPSHSSLGIRLSPVMSAVRSWRRQLTQGEVRDAGSCRARADHLEQPNHPRRACRNAVVQRQLPRLLKRALRHIAHQLCNADGVTQWRRAASKFCVDSAQTRLWHRLVGFRAARRPVTLVKLAVAIQACRHDLNMIWLRRGKL